MTEDEFHEELQRILKRNIRRANWGAALALTSLLIAVVSIVVLTAQRL